MQYLMLLFLIFLIVVIIKLIISLKKSKAVDKLSDELFSPVKETVDNVMTKIENGKDTLVETTKENAKAIKDKVSENEKINQYLNKGD